MSVFWLLLGAAMFGWGGYLVGKAGFTRQEMRRYPLRHHSGEPEF